MDSVKEISYSDGRSITLSKNHGIAFFELSDGTIISLRGVENENLGEKPLGFDEIFDFNVGDVFQYYQQEQFDVNYCEGYHKKRTILSKTVLPDEFICEVEEIWNFSYSCWSINNSGIQTITLSYKREHFNYEDLPNHSYIDMGFRAGPFSCTNTLFEGTRVKHYEDSNGIRALTAGLTITPGQGQFYKDAVFDYEEIEFYVLPLADTSGFFPGVEHATYYPPYLDGETFKEGLGRVLYHGSEFEALDYDVLPNTNLSFLPPLAKKYLISGLKPMNWKSIKTHCLLVFIS